MCVIDTVATQNHAFYVLAIILRHGNILHPF